MTTLQDLDNRLIAVENIIGGGNIVANSLLLEPVSTHTVYKNNNLPINSTSSLYEPSITSLVPNTTGSFTLIGDTLGGKSLMAFKIDPTGLTDLAPGFTNTTISINNGSFTAFIPLVENTAPTIIYDSDLSEPIKTETLHLSFLLVPAFNNYSSTAVNTTGLSIIKDTTNTLTGEGFELFRANYINSTINITVVSQLRVQETGTGTDYINTSILQIANNSYTYDITMNVSLTKATIETDNSNTFTTSILEGDTIIPSGSNDVRTLYPITTSGLITLNNASGTIYFTQNTINYSRTHFSTLDLNLVSSLSLSDLGNTQVVLDSTLTTILGADNSNKIKLTINDVPPMINTTEFSVNSSTNLSYSFSNLSNSSFVNSVYSATVVRSNVYDFSNFIDNATINLIPYGTTRDGLNGISGNYAVIPNNYTLTISQVSGCSLYSGTTLVSNTAIFNDNGLANTNSIDTTYNTTTFIKGISFDANGFNNDNSGIYGIKYTIGTSGTIVPVNNVSKLFAVSETNIIAQEGLSSLLMVLKTDIIENNPDATISNSDITGVSPLYTLGNSSGLLSSEFLLINSKLEVSRAYSSQIIPGTNILVKLDRVDNLGGGFYKYRFVVKFTYPDTTSDYNIVEFNTQTNSTTVNSDITGVFKSTNYLYIPINIDNVLGYYLRFNLANLTLANIGKTSIIDVPLDIKNVLLFQFYVNGVDKDGFEASPSWDNEAPQEGILNLVDGGIIYWYLVNERITLNKLNGTDNLIVFQNNDAGFYYNLYELSPELNTTLITNNNISINSSTNIIQVDSYLAVKYIENFYHASNDTIDYYYFFRPIGELSNTTSGETSNKLYIVSQTQVVNVVNGDGIYVDNFNLGNLTVGSQSFSPMISTFRLRNNSGTYLTSNVSPVNTSGVYTYTFASGVNTYLELFNTTHTIGFASTTYPVVYTTRNYTSQIVDSSLNTISGLSTVNSLIYDNSPLLVNISNTPITLSNSSQTDVNAKRTGVLLDRITDKTYISNSLSPRELNLQLLTSGYSQVIGTSQTSVITQALTNLSPNKYVSAIAEHPNGDIYIGGNFSTINGINVNFIVRYNPASNTWHQLGDGLYDLGVGSVVYAISIASNGDVYIGGGFSGYMNGTTQVPSRCFVKYVPSTNSFVSFGDRFISYVKSILIIDDTSIYIGGNFSALTGLSNSSFIVKYNPTSNIYQTVGLGLVNDVVETISYHPSGDIYIGGSFTSAGGIAVNRIAKYTPSTNSWTTLGTGVNNTVNSIKIYNNDVYIGGYFTTANGTTANRIVKYTPSTDTWSAIGVGVNSFVNTLNISSTGELYIGGWFNFANGSIATYIVKYDIPTNTWTSFNSTSSTVRSIFIASNNAVYVGGSFTIIDGVNANYIALLRSNQTIPIYSASKYITPARTIDLEFANNNVILSQTKFNNVIINSGYALLKLNGDYLTQKINGSSTIIPNASLLNVQSSGHGYNYTITQSFLPSNFNVNEVLRRPYINVSTTGFNVNTEITNTTPIQLIGSGELTGLSLIMNEPNIYNLTQGTVYSQKFLPAKVSITNSNGVKKLIRNDTMDTSTYVDTFVDITNTIYVKQSNNLPENLMFYFNKQAGYSTRVIYEFDAGKFYVYVYTYENPEQNIIPSIGNSTFKLKWISKRFSDVNITENINEGYQLINGATNEDLPIKFTANDQFFIDVASNNGLFVHVSNDLYPLAIRNTGPNTTGEYSVLVANDVSNIYQMIAVNDLAVLGDNLSFINNIASNNANL